MYTELHARSAFSFLEGSSLPEELVAACARLNQPAMALLDTDGVYGAPRFHRHGPARHGRRLRRPTLPSSREKSKNQSPHRRRSHGPVSENK
ncbi:MAG: PHP domain-containing protein [Candidatus Sulfotelmatobacter sp.]